MIQTVIDEMINLARVMAFDIKEIRIHPLIFDDLIMELGSLNMTAGLSKIDTYQGYPVIRDRNVILEVKKP